MLKRISKYWNSQKKKELDMKRMRAANVVTNLRTLQLDSAD